jgi:hypothetical protein
MSFGFQANLFPVLCLRCINKHPRPIANQATALTKTKQKQSSNTAQPFSELMYLWTIKVCPLTNCKKLRLKIVSIAFHVYVY